MSKLWNAWNEVFRIFSRIQPVQRHMRTRSQDGIALSLYRLARAVDKFIRECMSMTERIVDAGKISDNIREYAKSISDVDQRAYAGTFLRNGMF